MKLYRKLQKIMTNYNNLKLKNITNQKKQNYLIIYETIWKIITILIIIVGFIIFINKGNSNIDFHSDSNTSKNRTSKRNNNDDDKNDEDDKNDNDTNSDNNHNRIYDNNNNTNSNKNNDDTENINNK